MPEERPPCRVKNVSAPHRRTYLLAEPANIRDEAVAYMAQYTNREIIRAAEEGEGDANLLDCLHQLLCSEAEDWVQDYIDLLNKTETEKEQKEKELSLIHI